MTRIFNSVKIIGNKTFARIALKQHFWESYIFRLLPGHEVVVTNATLRQNCYVNQSTHGDGSYIN